MENREEKIQELANRIQELLMPLDLFAHTLDDEEIELLDECVDSLREKISHNESALPVIMALGGSYDSTEDRMKLKTAEALKELIDIRLEFKKEVESKSKMRSQNMQLLRAMGIM